ncbi:MAG: hypothetical protein OEL88_11215 [Sterolibacteriaceae bacterium MAG5]|nr:hypothetical protein [Candidatus Nitricoxidireducens bremensis]
MSKFDSHYQSKYVDRIRQFLTLPKKNFLRNSGLVVNPEEPRVGKLPAYPVAAVTALERAANRKAARCEANDTILPERLALARDYALLQNADLARLLGVSRELVRQWHVGKTTPTNAMIDQLAACLQAPGDWLRFGGEGHLPANSHLGLRFGNESRHWRERLHGATVARLTDLPEAVSAAQINALIEGLVFVDREMSCMARRAGGRWYYDEGLVFAPWAPLPARGLVHRHWPDQTEAIIREELAAKPSVYGAWHAVRERCEAAGLAYPKMISLQKRVAVLRQRRELWGVDLGEQANHSR